MQFAGRTGGASEIIAETAAGILLVAAMVFGGGPRGAGDAVVHLLAVPALVFAVMRWRHAASNRAQRLLLYWVLAAFVVIALQLLPLPAAIYAHLPQRGSVLADLEASGVQRASWPMTLDHWGAVRTALAFATFAAMALLVATLPHVARQRLLMLALIVALPMALLGFAQAAAGSHAPLRLYGFHHDVGAIGLFANRNHYADLLGALLPFALAFAVQAQRQQRKPLAACWYATAVILLLATALSFSRAGIAVAMLGLVASVLVLRPASVAGRGRWLPLAALGVSVLAVAVYAWDGIVARLVNDPADDLRWQYLRYGLDTAHAYLPWGSGLGAFRFAYAPFEPIAAMTSVYADRAHDDLLQVAIEAGIPGLLLIAALLALIAYAGIGKAPPVGAPHGRDHESATPGATLAARNAAPTASRPWGAPTNTDASIVPRAAAIAVTIPLLHSLVDYPLRTLAIAVVFALALSTLLAGRTTAPRAR